MKEILISGGLVGIDQSVLITQCRTYNTKKNPNGFTGKEIREILTEWRIRAWVQRFEVRKGYAKKPTNVWRATNEIKSARI
jgi:hypothetical protein